MLRSWLLGIFVIGLAAFCVVRARFSPEREEVQTASAAHTQGGAKTLPAPAEGGDSSSVLSDPAADLAATLSLEEVFSGEDPENSEARAIESISLPTVELPEEPGNPGQRGGEIQNGDGLDAEAAAPPESQSGPDRTEKLAFERDVPGGGSDQDRAEARETAALCITAANQSSSDIEIAQLLSQALLSGGLTEEEEDQVYAGLKEVNARCLLDPRNNERSFRWQVDPGDSLWKICRNVAADGHGAVAPGLVRLLNGMQTDSIHPGQRLKIPVDPLRIVVDKGRYQLFVLLGDIVIRRYGVGLGRADAPTPEGVFQIKTRTREPDWFKPGVGKVEYGDPENLLGTRWLGFKEQADFPNAATYGIHGTWEPKTIGGSFSSGCVRMLNEDIEELFEWIERGVEVEIRR